MIQLEINGKKVKVKAGATVLEAAQSIGIKVPTLCHVKGIEPYGACRLCTVEITAGGRTSFQASCYAQAQDGMVVQTETPAVIKGRKLLLELLLARCPKVPQVRKLAAEWGVRSTPFSRKNEDCVLCGLCARTCAGLMKKEAIAFNGRGTSRKVGTPFGVSSDVCAACGVCTYVCPTGRIQMEAETTAALKKKVGTQRQCRYMLMGLISSKLCPHNYECHSCPFDQTMENRFGTHPAFAAAAAQRKAG